MTAKPQRAVAHLVAATLLVNALLWGVEAVRMGYERWVVLPSHEETLRKDLRMMRRMIDRFTADQERAPQTLEELVEGRYLPEVPVDPMTGSSDTWELVMEEGEAVSLTGERGIADVKSGSQGCDSSGERRYSDW